MLVVGVVVSSASTIEEKLLIVVEAANPIVTNPKIMFFSCEFSPLIFWLRFRGDYIFIFAIVNSIFIIIKKCKIKFLLINRYLKYINCLFFRCNIL